ncbi:dihydrofolate reductase [Phreatobacter sp.]|uniref:dihydrofolate reductase n=1 Tax=Phreatobacter sp. TaxID=1966341 RepID=UPI003F6FE791
MNPSIAIEGHAIVSADGMIAGPDGIMPAGLMNDADWRLFQAALDRAALVVLGRAGHERHANPGRRRLVLTRGVTRLEADAGDPLAMRWNPDGLGFDAVLSELGIRSGTVAITGGTAVFDLFLTLGYDRFVLSTASRVSLTGGRPCFSSGHPEAVLARSGLRPGPVNLIDPQAGVARTVWSRA